MAQQTIGVFSKGSDLVAALRQACPEWRFAASADGESTPVVVVDGEGDELVAEMPHSNVVRLALHDKTPSHSPRHSELRVRREVFLANPGEYLRVASDLADALIHTWQLEQEVGYLTQIQELMAMVEADAVSERITRTVLNLLDLPSGALLLHDPRLERYVISFGNDPTCEETGDFLPGVPPDLLQKALASGDLFSFDAETGLIVMPLQVGDDLIGVIRVPVTKTQRFDDGARAGVSRYLRAVVQVLGNIYQLTRSRDLAMRDDLTKAFNRRFFESYLDEEMERSRRYGSLFSIIFLDLDDLKMVNNFYGHLSGSRTLQEVAKRILNAVRGIDKVVRFGGDEFCIILPQTDQDQAVAVANRIRKALVASPFQLEPNIAISITASFGIATYPTHALSKEDLIRQADAAMYRVKSTTKNAVGIASIEDARPARM
jgi:diguanylate cyclase (GGDEF)-like protein